MHVVLHPFSPRVRVVLHQFLISPRKCPAENLHLNRRKPTPQPQKTYTSNGSKPDFSAENLHLNRRKPTPFRRKPTPLDFQKMLKSPEITGFLALPSAPL